MSARELPARPHLDHLKNEAKALLKAFNAGEPDALRRIRAVLGDKRDVKLSDAQRVIAREHGFPTCAQLRTHVQASRSLEEAVDEFLAAAYAQDVARAREVIRLHPRVATDSIHVAAALGNADDVRRLIAEDPSRATARVWIHDVDPLLVLCYSPFHGENAERDAGLLATARILLDAGADPNTKDSQYRVPALYAVTGPRSVLPIARLLLDAGADPNDGESVFHAAEAFHEDALELLLRAGVDLNFVGEWGNTALYFLLRWHDIEREPRTKQGLLWLLSHGADPNVICAAERETSLHVAARRGQSVDVIKLLLDHGADVHIRRADGKTPWDLAARGGFDAVADLLETAGAMTAALSDADLLLAACGRGDADEARRRSSTAVLAELLPADFLLVTEAAENGRTSTVAACLAAGFPVDTIDANGATALHYSAIRGRLQQVQMLLEVGAALDIRDKEHSSTPLGWAFFGADFIREHLADRSAPDRHLHVPQAG